MDFGKILDSWDNQENKGKKTGKKKNDMERLLDLYEPGRRDIRDDSSAGGSEHPSENRKRLQHMKPQASLDLHGRTAAEARVLINAFIEESAAKGHRKVVIVHGKGHHSVNGPVLSGIVLEEVEHHPLAGENGPAAGRDGGRGARWIILRGK